MEKKPSIQALELKTRYVETRNGKLLRGIQSIYKRNGALKLFAAKEVATGLVNAKTTATKTREDFIAYMDEIAT